MGFLTVGHIIGAVLAAVTFSLTVVSFPRLIGREVDFITAMITSVRAVATNPAAMLGWALCVVLMLEFKRCSRPRFGTPERQEL